MQLNKPASLAGIVTPFRGNGRKLGYPTANIKTKTDLIDGVYFGYADLADWHNHPVLVFIGTPTTLGDTERRVEAYLLDIPDQDYYGRELELKVNYYHRRNQTFENVEKLLDKMKQDEKTARDWFKNN